MTKNEKPSQPFQLTLPEAEERLAVAEQNLTHARAKLAEDEQEAQMLRSIVHGMRHLAARGGAGRVTPTSPQPVADSDDGERRGGAAQLNNPQAMLAALKVIGRFATSNEIHAAVLKLPHDQLKRIPSLSTLQTVLGDPGKRARYGFARAMMRGGTFAYGLKEWGSRGLPDGLQLEAQEVRS